MHAPRHAKLNGARVDWLKKGSSKGERHHLREPNQWRGRKPNQWRGQRRGGQLVWTEMKVGRRGWVAWVANEVAR